jgi:hypothetical protein
MGKTTTGKKATVPKKSSSNVTGSLLAKSNAIGRPIPAAAVGLSLPPPIPGKRAKRQPAVKKTEKEGVKKGKEKKEKAKKAKKENVKKAKKASGAIAPIEAQPAIATILPVQQHSICAEFTYNFEDEMQINMGTIMKRVMASYFYTNQDKARRLFDMLVGPPGKEHTVAIIEMCTDWHVKVFGLWKKFLNIATTKSKKIAKLIRRGRKLISGVMFGLHRNVSPVHHEIWGSSQLMLAWLESNVNVNDVSLHVTEQDVHLIWYLIAMAVTTDTAAWILGHWNIGIE